LARHRIAAEIADDVERTAQTIFWIDHHHGRAEGGHRLEQGRQDRAVLHWILGRRHRIDQAMADRALHTLPIVGVHGRAILGCGTALEPASRRVATQAGFAGARAILIGDRERRQHQQVATGMRHHRALPVAVGLDVGLPVVGMTGGPGRRGRKIRRNAERLRPRKIEIATGGRERLGG
jgi:hypothetical protein